MTDDTPGAHRRTPPAPSEWIASVEVDTDAEATAELARRWPTLPAERAILVTDLLDPRKGFWRMRVSLPKSPRARPHLERGVRLHAALGEILGPDVPLEVSVRRDGIVARIDAFADVPLELKTGTRPVPAEELLGQRPDAVGQLAVYCALIDRTEGRLVHVGGPAGGSLEVAVAEFRFRDPEDGRAEVSAAAERLRSAVRQGEASGLPPCRWRDRGCEYQEAGVCDCTGREPEAAVPFLGGAEFGGRRTDLEAAYRPRFNASASEPPSSIRTFDSLIYPRSAYFEHTHPIPPAPAVAGPGPGLAPDLFERLVAAVEAGPMGETRRVVPRADGSPEMVALWRGQPYLVRTSRSYFRPNAVELRTAQTQYALQLGFRCVAIGAPEGRLVLGWDRAGPGEFPVQVLRYKFRSPGVFARMWRERVRALAETEADGHTERLPACPTWKAENCPYQPGCACPTRVSR